MFFDAFWCFLVLFCTSEILSQKNKIFKAGLMTSLILLLASDFLKKQIETKRVNSCLAHCSHKKKKNKKKQKKVMNKKHSQVFLKIGLPNRKNYGENGN